MSSNKRVKFNTDSHRSESLKSHPDSEKRKSSENAASGEFPVHSHPPSSLMQSDSSEGPSSLTEHTSSVSSASVSNQLPRQLSQWERKDIEDLNIKIVFESETRPYELLTDKSWNGRRKGEGFPVNFSVFEAEEKEKRRVEEELRIQTLVDYVKSSGFLKLIEEINYSSFEEFDISTVMKLKYFLKQSFIPRYLPGEFHSWFARFDIEVKNFIKIFLRLIENIMEGGANHRCLYQHLFDAFVKIFGMHSGISFQPNVQVESLEIRNTKVRGAPDIIYYHHRINEGEERRPEHYVVAVCEVKKDKPLPKESTSSSSSSKTGNRSEYTEVSSSSSSSSSTSSSSSSSSTVYSTKCHQDLPQISDNLIGQHCGELLLKFDQSIHCNSVYGIVVQQTCVTVAELGMTPNQYLKLKEGRLKHSDGDRPSFTFTKPYNFLKKEELENLLGPIIKFGLEQED